MLDALAAAGKDLDNLTEIDLAVSDHFHGGGRPATLRLAALAGLDQHDESRRVLDVGGGLGGPARTLAALSGCHVTVIDLAPSYVEAARMLTAKVGCQDTVSHQVGDALALPFGDGEFDVVWTQNSGMNIADKDTLYRGFHRVLRSGGTLAFQEPVAGAASPPYFPLMWADDASMSHLLSGTELRDLVAATGFDEVAWNDVSETATSAAAPPAPAHGVQRLIMGDERLEAVQAAGRRNLAEDRIGMVHAVFRKR